MNANVVVDGDSVYLRDVPMRKGEVKSVFHYDGYPDVLRTMLEYKGVEDKYLDDAIFGAITGLGFRFWFSPDWASCLAYTFEQQTGIVVAEILGFDCGWHRGVNGGDIRDMLLHKKALDESKASTAWEGVKDEIEQGHPVAVFGDDITDPKAGPILVVGFSRKSDLMYFVPGSAWGEAPKWDDRNPKCRNGIKEYGYWAQERPNRNTWVGMGYAPGQGMGGSALSYFCIKDRKSVPSENEIAMKILGRMVRFLSGDLKDALRPDRKPGLEAYKLLSEALAQDSESYQYNGKSLPWSKVGDTEWWYAMDCFGRGGFYRKGVCDFLERIKDGFGDLADAQKEQVSRAKELFEESDGHMERFWQHFEKHGPTDITDMPSATRTVNSVMSDGASRKEAADIIQRIHDCEQNAVSCLREAF